MTTFRLPQVSVLGGGAQHSRCMIRDRRAILRNRKRDAFTAAEREHLSVSAYHLWNSFRTADHAQIGRLG